MLSDSEIEDLLDHALTTSQLDEAYRLNPTLPPSLPTDADRATVNNAITEARLHGLRFPDPQLRFVYAEGRSRGQAEHRRSDGSLTMSLNLAEIHTLQDLRDVVLHECMHLHDLHAGDWGRLSIAERERRAIRFSRDLEWEAVNDSMADRSPSSTQAENVAARSV